SLRKVAVPRLSSLRNDTILPKLVMDALKSSDSTAFAVDAYVAKCIYGLTHGEYKTILEAFSSLTDDEHHEYLKHYRNISKYKYRASCHSTTCVAEAATEYRAA
ncbi:MAG TPA: hypothetical protein VMH83_10595, partial [Candidatus Acidoferrum sp.]|nr:hypothetical protein [Candidatus Acidoferrum sp.]